ncbi:MAG: hypothetical protein GY795_29330, partial [Desulfobacterales bacterium]|nr:hypothetical protein [Desulfobacterales bacterium]
LSVGTHTVSFKTVSGWTAPSDQTVNIVAGQTGNITGTYTEEQQSDNEIKGIVPASAKQGETVTVTLTLQGSMLPPADATPDTVTIGTVQGTDISWDGTSITVKFSIPDSEPVGAKDVSVGFPAPSDLEPLVITKTGGFQVESGQADYTLTDAIRILQILCGITVQEGYEDVNGDNKAGLEDVVYILQSLVLETR